MEAFYDQKASAGSTIEERRESPIYALRQLNNWVKACLVSEYTPPLAVVLDLCCGRGGDMEKWRSAGVKHVVFVDISEASIREAAARYDKAKDRCPFKASFLVDDCSTLSKMSAKEPFVDVVSCQFALHYCFDSFERAKRTFQSVAARLKKGGHFIGTIPSAERILRKLRNVKPQQGQQRSIGNAFYKICMEDEYRSPDTYTFTLVGAIDAVPEHFVRLHTLLAAAILAGLTPVRIGVSFEDFLAEKRDTFASLRPNTELSAELQEIFALYDVFVFRKD